MLEALSADYDAATIAEEASAILSASGFRTFTEAPTRHVAAAYVAKAATSHNPQQASAALANAALWLQEAHDSSEHIMALVNASFLLAVQTLSPSLQFVVLRACTKAIGGLRSLSTAHEALATALQSRVSFLARQILFWSPPLPLVVRIEEIDAVSRTLHQAFLTRIRISDAFLLKDLPDVDVASQLGAFEAASSRNRSSLAAETLRVGAVQAALKIFTDLRGVTVFPSEHVVGAASLGAVPPASPQAHYHCIRGVRADEDTGRVELLLERPRFLATGAASPALTSEVVAAAFEVEQSPQLQITTPDLTMPSATAQASLAAHHPFWLVRPGYDHTAPLSGWMLEATWAVQNALGEISMPSSVTALASIEMACSQVSYRRHKIGFGVVDFIFDLPELSISARLQGERDAAPIADALSTLLGMPSRNTSSMAARGTLHLIRRLCALRAAAALLNGTVVASDDHLKGQDRPSDETSNDGRAAEAANQRMQLEQRELDPDRVAAWLEVLGELHAEVLRSFGFINLDPGDCWDEAFNFAKCCSIGEYSDVCWQPGFSEERCCLGQALPATDGALAEVAASQLANVACGPDAAETKPAGWKQLVAAVSTWLRHPTGSTLQADKRLSHSRGVVEIIEHMGNERHGMAARSPPASIKHAADSHAPDARLSNAMTPAVVVRPNSIAAAQHIAVDMSPPELKERVSTPATASWPPESLEAAGIVTTDMQRLQKAAAEASEIRAALPLASAAPRVRTLSRLRSMLWRRFSMHGHGEARDKDIQAWRAASQNAGGIVGPRPRDYAGKSWREVTEDLSSLQVGTVVRISTRDGLRPSELAEVLSVLIEPSTMGKSERKVTRLRSSQGHILYYDLSLPEWKVEVPLLTMEENGSELRWPECLRKDESIRATDDAGLFVNLLVFGIRRGCFRDDCSHSDHFDATNPAACARTCSSIRACRVWSFWPSRSGGTCWMRRHDRYRIGMQSSISGSVDCKPPAGAPDGSRAKPGMAEPTLFALAKRLGSTLAPSHPAHQWDLLRIMQSFGSLTASQVQAAEPSPLQRSALRFAWRAEQYLQHLSF